VRLIYAERTNANGSASESTALDVLEQWLPMGTTAVA
jgi:hypothetical protein